MTDLPQQLAQIKAMALQHFPNEPVARLEYELGLLEQRRKEYHTMFLQLEVRDTVTRE
jgi:hypothetical protein